MNILFKTYEEKFREGALNSGYSEENIIRCLDYSRNLYENGVPIIYNLTHLSKLTGYKRGYLIQAAVVSKYSTAYYRYCKIPKKKGGFRTIREPLPNLKQIQYWILENILSRVAVSTYAKAYIKNKGLKDNLKFHKKQPLVLSVDIENFFPSITDEKVIQIFASLGYSEVLCTYLSKLCCLKGNLPQGAPTSPYLSNLVMSEVDRSLGLYCQENNIRFTRYADDLTFSGNFEHKALLEYIENKLAEEGFALNSKKTKLMRSSDRQIVTGIVVNQKIQLPKSQRKDIRQAIYYIRKFGLNSHMAKVNLTKRNYLNHLIGKIGFGFYLNPDDKELKDYLEFTSKLLKEEKN